MKFESNKKAVKAVARAQKPRSFRNPRCAEWAAHHAPNMSDFENADILKLLKEYAKKDILPLHMPGHKRGHTLLGAGLPWQIDVTEIADFDNLHNPAGILQKSMEKACALWQSDRAFFSVGGSTACILAGIRACVKYGDKILVARNCHKSVFNAIELCGLFPVYIDPAIDSAFNICGSINPESVIQALSLHPCIKLAVITSPTYEGVISDIACIASVLHEKNIPLMVDEAHGAHLYFSGTLPKGALYYNADIVVHSLHKTLSGLTQTAVLHANGNYVDFEKIAHQMTVFQSSSPSYILLASIDHCICLLKQHGKTLTHQWQKRLSGFDRKISSLKYLRVLCHGSDQLKKHPEIFDFDKGKLVIDVQRTNFKGKQFSSILLDKYKIQTEFEMVSYVLAMTSLFDEEKTFDILAKALLDTDIPAGAHKKELFAHPHSAEQKISIADAVSSPHTFLPFDKSLGYISAEYIWAYPPGIPLIVPGQTINRELTELVPSLIEAGIAVHSTYRQVPASVYVVK